MNTTQTQVRSTDEALSVFDTLKMALEALKDNQHLVADSQRHMYVMEYNSIIEKCEEALAQQPQNEVRGLSHSNEQSKCNHTKTITRSDIDGNQIETTCGECGERVAQQPQDVVRGLLSNEQVEPVAQVNKDPDTGKLYVQWTMPWSLFANGTKLYTHPPVPTAQPDCTRSHPHEEMSKECELRTEIARLTNQQAHRSQAQLQLKMTALERAWFHGYENDIESAMHNLREEIINPALAQQSNEQVEPVAKVNFYTGKIEWLMPVSFDIPVTIDVPPMYLYTHPPVPYVVEPRNAPTKLTAQPKWIGLTIEDKHEYLSQDFGGSRADAMDWAEKRLKEKNNGT